MKSVELLLGVNYYAKHDLFTISHFNSQIQPLPSKLLSPFSRRGSDFAPHHTEPELGAKPGYVWFTPIL